MEAQDAKLPINQKFALTINEASEYSGIGTTTLRRIIKEDPYCYFVIKVGKKYLIKRELFEQYLQHTEKI